MTVKNKVNLLFSDFYHHQISFDVIMGYSSNLKLIQLASCKQIFKISNYQTGADGLIIIYTIKNPIATFTAYRKFQKHKTL